MQNLYRMLILSLLLPSMIGFAGCGNEDTFGKTRTSQRNDTGHVTLVATPSASVILMPDSSMLFGAEYDGKPDTMTWQLATSGADSGSITTGGKYTAPVEIGSLASVDLIGESRTHVGSTVTVTIALQNPTPVISSLTPSSADSNALYSGVIKGKNFVPNSKVQVSGLPVKTSFLDSSTLSFEAPVAISSPTISVQNPAPGGGVSAPAYLTVNPPVVLTCFPGNTISIDPGATIQISVLDVSTPEPMSWSLATNTPDQGSITSAGLYTAPLSMGIDASVRAVGRSTLHLGASVDVLITFRGPKLTVTGLTPQSAAAYTPYQGK